MSIAAKCTCFKRPSGWCSGDDCPKAIKQNDDKQLIEKYSVIIAEFMDKNFYKIVINDKKYYCNYGQYYKLNEVQNALVKVLINEPTAKIQTETKYLNYHKDWNEIHKVWWKLREYDDKIHKKLNRIEFYIIDFETPYEAFKIIGETIEYLNTIK